MWKCKYFQLLQIFLYKFLSSSTNTFVFPNPSFSVIENPHEKCAQGMLEGRDRDDGSIGVLAVEVSPWKLRWKREKNDVELLRAGNYICKDSMENISGWTIALGFQLLLHIHSCFLCLILYMHLSAGEAYDSDI